MDSWFVCAVSAKTQTLHCVSTNSADQTGLHPLQVAIPIYHVM